MKKYYTAVGIVSIILVAVLLLTCPKESDFQSYLEDKYTLCIFYNSETNF